MWRNTSWNIYVLWHLTSGHFTFRGVWRWCFVKKTIVRCSVLWGVRCAFIRSVAASFYCNRQSFGTDRLLSLCDRKDVEDDILTQLLKKLYFSRVRRVVCDENRSIVITANNHVGREDCPGVVLGSFLQRDFQTKDGQAPLRILSL